MEITKRRFKDRLEEHKTAIRTKNLNYPVAAHYKQVGHGSPSSLNAVALECGVMELKEEEGQHFPCGVQVRKGEAGLCHIHYREYLVSLINDHSIDPASLYDKNELLVACRRYHVVSTVEDRACRARLLKRLIASVPLGDKIPRKK